MANDIQLKRSSVAGKVPDAANVLVGEPVVNLTDKILYTKDGTGNVIVIGAGTTSNVTEGVNLYFSNARVKTAISSQLLDNASFSGAIVAGGELSLGAIGGDEGGQINLGKPAANTSLAGNVAIDIYQNKLRIFEGGGSARGVYVDLTAAGAGVSTNLIGSGSGTITSVAGITSGAVSNAQLAAATVTSQTLSNATFSANVAADRFISNNNGNGENYRVGDDAWIGDINLANTIRIKGAQDSANAYINFGTSDAATLGRSGTGALTYTGAFTATGNVSTGNVSGTAGTFTFSRLGTVQSGTWNGSSISTTYTEAKVAAVAGATGDISNTQLASGISSSGILTTANVSEVTNLYFTNTRVYSNVTQLGYITSSSLSGYATNAQLSSYATTANLALKANIVDLTTANVTEVTNLYFTNTRVYSNVTQLGYITSSSLSGYATNSQLGLYATNAQLELYSTNANSALKANIADLTTANVTELTNLYFSNARVYSNVTQLGYITSATLSGYATNAQLALYATNSQLDSYATISYVNDAVANTAGSPNVILGVMVQDTYTANGTGTTYVLTHSTSNANSIIVFVDSVLQSPFTNYTVSGATLTFVSAPDASANIDVRYFAQDEFDISLGMLNNVSNTSPLTGQALIWSGTEWAPANVATTANVISVNGQTGVVNLTTTDISEGANLYYSNTRVYSNVTQLGYITSSALSGYATILFQDDVPSSPTGNTLWWQSNTGVLKVYYTDADSGQWVDATPATPGASVSLSDDTSTNATYYPLFTTDVTSTLNTTRASTSKLTYNPSTGTLTSTIFSGSHTGNGTLTSLVVNGGTAATTTTTGTVIVTGGMGLSGNVYAGGVISGLDLLSTSDKRLKKNISTIETPLNTVQELRGVAFQWKKSNKDSIGVIAQEVEEILPQVVETDGSGYKTVSYGSIVGLLIEAIKEQQEQINELKRIINAD